MGSHIKPLTTEMSSSEGVSFSQLENNSKRFFSCNPGCKVQTTHNMIGSQIMMKHRDQIEMFANKAYPVIHERVLTLIEDFLSFKLVHGSPIEKSLYRYMSVPGFVDRLVSARPLVFYTSVDSWLTKDNKYGTGGWENIGTTEESGDLTLENYLSYDEIKISALLQLSTPTMLINNGSRDNVGRPGQDGSFIKSGVYVGAVGARFEVEGKMEYQDIVVSKNQNTERRGYGETNTKESVLSISGKFYLKKNFPSYGEALKYPDGYEVVKSAYHDFLFNKNVYRSRIQISAETFLIEANSRGRVEGREVYCHVVGLGLGVWQVSRAQNRYFLEAWLRALSGLKLETVKDVDFSWISKNDNVPELKDGEKLEGTNIKIQFSRRNPFDPLATGDQDKLVVAMFAWDGNSFVGNEYWSGLLSASGDPAAACCSNIPELLNPDINPRVRGGNLHIASVEHGIRKYEEQMLNS